MTENARLQAVMDKFEIIETSTISLCCRDSGDWARLAQCFHPEAKLTTETGSRAGNHFAGPTWKLLDGTEVEQRLDRMEALLRQRS